MSGLVEMGKVYLWLSLMAWGWIVVGGGRVDLDPSRGMVLKFFNRSPITLKFEAGKLERESQARERERERARARASESERSKKRSSCCFTVVSCYSIFVSWHSILVICYFYL